MHTHTNKMILVETRSSLMARPSETLLRINLMSVKCYLQALAALAESKRKLMMRKKSKLHIALKREERYIVTITPY